MAFRLQAPLHAPRGAVACRAVVPARDGPSIITADRPKAPNVLLEPRSPVQQCEPTVVRVVSPVELVTTPEPLTDVPPAPPQAPAPQPAEGPTNGSSNGRPTKAAAAAGGAQQHSFTVLQEVRGANMDVSNIVVRAGHRPPPEVEAAAQVSALAPHHAPPVQKLLISIENLFMPDGWDQTPSSITPDYLKYQLMTLPTHVLGNVAHALTTSSLLQAVGANAGPAAVVGTSAAIKWITKEGIGALGRFVVGGSLASQFDRDPRRWRMVAESFTALGAGLEVATAAFPQHFLLLASMGQFTRALGKAIGKPVFRVIQTHFARSNNVGAVAAKQEVWEVCAQLLGYAVSLSVLSAVDQFIAQKGSSSGTELVAIWAVVQSSHFVLRYHSLRTLVFEVLNEKRARLLVGDHVAGRPLRDPGAVNLAEPMLLPPEICMQPAIHIGDMGVLELLELASLVAPTGDGSLQPTADALMAVYEHEHHVLVWDADQQVAHAVLREEAPPGAVLRVLYQAHWLHHQQQQQLEGGRKPLDGMAMLAASVQALQRDFGAFEQEAVALGWDIAPAVLMGTGPVRFRTL